MLRPRRDWLPSAEDRFTVAAFTGCDGDRAKAARPFLVRDPHRSVHVLFHQHVGDPDRLMNLIESPSDTES
jgi:hypothetical protein